MVQIVFTVPPISAKSRNNATINGTDLVEYGISTVILRVSNPSCEVLAKSNEDHS